MSLSANAKPDLEMESDRDPNRTNARMKVLLADSDRRPYTPRLAMAFSAIRCEVSAVCTSHNPIDALKTRPNQFPYSAVHPKASLLEAIQSAKPDLIVPCDDRAVIHLQQLCGQPGIDPFVVRVIERSLGPSGSYPVVSARYPLLELAKKQGVRVPNTHYLQTAQDLVEWRAKQPLPWVLKADGTWGGGGVRIVETPDQIDPLLASLGQPCKLRSAMKRLILHRDPFYMRDWWQRYSRPIIAQAYIAGSPANCAVACWKGKVLAQINVEVLATSVSTGPAKVVRVIDNPEMTFAAERIAENLQLSGFFGLDFIIEDQTEYALLIEMNPRCTPLSHIQLESGDGLIPALHAALANQPESIVKRSSTNWVGQTIAYFPQAHDSKEEFKESTFYDFPQSEPELVNALLHRFPKGTLLRRIADSLRFD